MFDGKVKIMDEFSKDIGQQLLTLLWYLSNYPDSEDYSETTRRDFFGGVVESIHPHFPNSEEAIQTIIRQFKLSFAGHPYEKRASQFADDLLEIIINNDDPTLLFIKGKNK